MWLVRHASCKRRLCGARTSGAACEHNGSDRELNPQQPSCRAKTVLSHSPHRPPPLFFWYEDSGGAFLSPILQKEEQTGCLHKCLAFSSETNGRWGRWGQMQRKSPVAQQRWIRDGGLLLTRFSFAPAFPLPCRGPDNMSARWAHYARRRFPPPSREKPAGGQVSIIHMWDEHECHSFHPCLTQV